VPEMDGHVIMESLVKNDNLTFDDIEKAKEFNIFFAAQSNIDDSNGTPPNEIQSLIENLEYIVLNYMLIYTSLHTFRNDTK
jgi:hypothetical protein